jgi:DNA-binding CsgD family transcriptional regulator
VLAADHYLDVGRWDEALAEVAEAADPLRSEPAYWLWLHGIGALIAAHRDDRPALSQHLNAVKGLPITAGDMRYFADYLRVTRAVAAERDGQPETALAPDPETGLGFPGADPPEEPLWLPHLVRLALAAGDQARAHAATQACATAARQMAMGPTGAAAEHCRGLLTADPAPVLAAADTYAQCGYPLLRAHALEDAAVLLAGDGQTPAARAAYTDALDIYTTLGAAWDTRRADARLRPLGLRRGVRGPRRRPTTGWQALTASELKIATLVAAGRSNPDIAVELFLSRSTVQTHVSHILAKLGAHSRIEIAREATRHTASTPD